MQKAAEDMKKRAEEEAEIKRKIIVERVAPLQVDGLSKCKTVCLLPFLFRCVSLCFPISFGNILFFVSTIISYVSHVRHSLMDISYI